MKRILFSLSLTVSVFAHYCVAQVADTCVGDMINERLDTLSVNKNLPKLILHTTIRDACCSIDVYEEGKPDVVQHIQAEFDGDFPPDGVRFADANFDGYQDILLFYNAGNTTNEDYAFWLFNPKSRQFVYNDEFTQAVGCNPTINEHDQAIETGGETGCVGMCFEFDTYEVHEGRLLLVERLSQELAAEPTESSPPIFVRTLERLQSGKMKVIARVKGTNEEIEEKANW